MHITGNAGFNYSQLLLQSVQSRTSQSSGADFTIEVEVSEVTVNETTAPRTVDDVKKEFYAYLDSLAISPGLSQTAISVNVTEAAFEKMLKDPEYMQKMKDLCARDLCDPAWNKMAAMGIAPTGSVITIDADCEEEYLASSWSYPGGEKKVNSDGFWTKKSKKNDAAEKAREKKLQEKQELMEYLQERADTRKRRTNELLFPEYATRGGADSYSAFSAGESVISSLV